MDTVDEGAEPEGYRKTMTADEVLVAMGMTPETIAREMRGAELARRDGRICICGHPMARHKDEAGVGIIFCRPSRLSCKCQTPYAVIEVRNTRPFMFRTTGLGLEHALQAGIFRCREKGIEITWLVPQQCEREGCDSTLGVQAVPLSDRMKPVAQESKINALMCVGCRAGLEPGTTFETGLVPVPNLDEEGVSDESS